jgi:hypothetical protein
LDAALEQAQSGKGKERHAVIGEPWDRQQICEIARRTGCGGPAYQVVKKTYEALRLPPDRGMAEVLGAINYLTAIYLVLEENLDDQ